MLEKLYTTKDVANVFGLNSPVAVIALMRDMGVTAYFLGVGRKRGYRFKEADILEALKAIEVNFGESSKDKLSNKSTKVDDNEDFWSQSLSEIKKACAKKKG